MKAKLGVVIRASYVATEALAAVALETFELVSSENVPRMGDVVTCVNRILDAIRDVALNSSVVCKCNLSYAFSDSWRMCTSIISTCLTSAAGFVQSLQVIIDSAAAALSGKSPS